MLATSDRAQLAYDTIRRRPVRGIPSTLLYLMEHAHIERLAGVEPGSYQRDPVKTYVAALNAAGICLIDQFVPKNPLTMGDHGYEQETARGVNTGGCDDLVLDGMVIDSPEAVVQHLETVAFPRLRREIATFDEAAQVREFLQYEAEIQAGLGPDILKGPYHLFIFPGIDYVYYGYEDYFMAVALYPEVIERHFALQADFAVQRNRAALRAFHEGQFPPYCRLDHDIADSRGTLISIKTLDEIWLPHFARSIQEVAKTDIRTLWHCDGNLMEMVPRLLEAGLKGFQGFQYEDGMDYRRICRLKTRDGDDLMIIAGVSVTRTLPRGTPDDVKREMAFLVENGPKTGLFLAGSSSITPGVPWENIKTLVEGLTYYRVHGRSA